MDVRPLSSLLPHEETIPSHVEQVAAQLKRDTVQKDPMVVDGASGTVLDGMHRLAALERLGIGNAICCTVDYSSSSVSLHRWARAYSGGQGDLRRELAGAGVTRATTIAEAYHLLETRSCGLVAFVSGNAYLPETKIGLSEAFVVVRRLDEFAQASGYRREFVPEDDVDSALQHPETVVLMVQRLGKDDVVSAARTNHLFPCKTSMHAIDPRPVAVNFPISQLGALTGDELRRRFGSSRGELLPPDSLYGGRRYKERLLLLSEP